MAKISGKKRVTFKLHNPGAKQVLLAGTFNDWSTEGRPLKPDASGTWRTWTMLPPGVYEYRFLVDGQWQDDPECEERRSNEFGTSNCVVRV
jgi:1,4-alpha-glucan branching enzyme